MFITSVPTYTLFMIFSAAALLINYHSQKEQGQIVRKYSATMLAPGILFMGIGMMVGIINGTGMVTAIVDVVMSFVPSFLVRWFHVIYAIIILPLEIFVPYQAFQSMNPLLLGMGAESCEQNGICGYQNVVEADGEVYPCDFYVLDEYKLGNLNEVSMEDIYEKRKAIGYIERSRNHARSCISCPYFHVCRGGCNRHRVYSEEENGYVNYFCPAYKMFFEQCYDRLCDVAMTVSRNLK